jgi:tRNA(fMet)-specific endonuclease VapC
MQFMLDTDVVSDSIRNPAGPAATRIAEEGRSRVGVSIIVAGELRFGALKRGSDSLSAEVREILTNIAIVPFEAPADEVYAAIRANLERAGTPIGGNDMLIAAHALALDCILVTGNEREFRRIKALKVENWLR